MGKQTSHIGFLKQERVVNDPKSIGTIKGSQALRVQGPK